PLITSKRTRPTSTGLSQGASPWNDGFSPTSISRKKGKPDSFQVNTILIRAKSVTQSTKRQAPDMKL
ncbi:MAG: hypothetical protein OQL20_12600, partial [Sedimenticola sp.]|nr:hypothetical protein [Sedimenticola sp.]